jgi:hypothetical protein
LVLQAPVALQTLAPVQVSGSSAFVTPTQVPPAPVQAWHVPHEATPQQRSSTQDPVAHRLAVALEQGLPGASFGEQVPAAQ